MEFKKKASFDSMKILKRKKLQRLSVLLVTPKGEFKIPSCRK